MASKTRYSRNDSRSINKSNTQASTSFRKSTQEAGQVKNCFFYKDGDLKYRPVPLVINPRRVLRLESIITELSTKIKGLPFGVRSIFTPRGNDMVTSLDGLEHGQSYVCSSKRHQAVGINTDKVRPPPRWYYDKPSSGGKEYNSLLQEYEFEDRARHVGRRYLPRDSRMAEAYNRNQPKKITVLKNGEPTVRHVVLINRRTAQSFEQILSDISSMFRLAVRKLYTVEGRRISSLTGMINGPDVLVAAGKEPFKTMVGFVFEPESTNASPSRIRSRLGTQNDDVANKLKRRRDRMMRTRGTWKVWCTTNELSRAGTSSQVTITVYGHKGNSGPIPLGYPDGINFQPGRIDEFDINVGINIGEIYKVRIAHDNTGEHPPWFCDEIRMKDVDTDEMLTFPCRRWLARDEDDHDVCREMPVVRRGEPHLPVIKYDVTVITGDLWNGGTQSNVYLTIYGERGDTGIRQLYVEHKDQAFSKGQANHFTLEAVSLGHLKKVIIGHDGTVPGDGWFLEKVSIQEPDAKPHEVYHFYCGRWLDEGEDDGKIVRELKVQDEYMEDILEKRNWEYEKWKFENKNQVTLISMLSGKALRIKSDGSVDGLGEENDNGSTFIISSKKPMIRIFTSLLNSNFHLAVDHGKVTGQGRGGPQCEFRIHVQSDRSVMLEAAKSPLQFITLQENGKIGDSRAALDKDPGKRFHVFVKGVMRHRGVVMLRTSNIQAISVDHDKSVYATGRCNRAAHFRVHKVESGGIRMFESMIYPGFYLRLKDGKFDCNGSRNEDSHFLMEKHKDKGYFTIQLNKQRGMFVGFTPRGGVRPTIDTGINNIHIFPEVIEAGMSKQKMIEDHLTPISERDGFDETPRSYRSPDPRKKPKPEFEEGDYSVLVSSDENLENAKLALLVFGDKGGTGQIMLNAPDNGPLFRGGNSDEFKINLSKIGKPFKIRLELIPKNHNKNFSWKVKQLVLTDMLTQEKLSFPFSRWMSRSKDDEEIMRELPVIRAGHESQALPVVKYFISVYTGKDPGSETNAEIYVNMHGDYGDTGKRQLRVSKNNRPKLFERGQVDQFEIEAVHLGKLSKIQIGHDETKPGEGWFLDKVVIREGRTANMEFVFPCGRWFDSSMEDRKLERDLVVQERAPSKISPVRELSNHPVLPPIGSPLSKWSDNTAQFEEEERRIMEGEVTEGEATDTLSHNAAETVESTEEETVDENNEVTAIEETEFEETEVEEEEVSDNAVEAIEEEPKGEEIEEEVEEKPEEEIQAEEETDFNDEETLPIENVKKDEKEEKPNTSIQLITHRDSSAKMEDTVVLYVYGYEGKLGPLVLGSGRDGLFQPGAEDKIQIQIYPDLGRWYKLRIGLTEEVEGADWHLDRLILTDTTYGNQMEFDVDRWMSRQRDDFDMWRELPVIRNDEPALPVVRYTIEVHTGDVLGADTEATININLIGQRGDSGKRRLYKTQTEGKMFSQGKIDSFVLEAVSLGDIQSVIVGHGDKTPGKGWYLTYVAVKELNSSDQQVETYFPSDSWFDAGQEDRLTERELYPGKRPQTKPESSGEYRMWVTTADDSEATEGGKAILVVYGEKGRSEDIKLFAPNSTAKLFDAGNSDEFEVSTGDLGPIYKIRVTMEDDPTWKSWHLEEVKMEDKVTGESFNFSFDRWFSRQMDDGDLCRELPVITSGKEPLPVKSYELEVTTGDHWAAETDANVTVTVFGSQGDTGKRLLHKTSSGRKRFSRGQVDEFTIEAVDLRGIERVEIEHDGKGPGAGWFLDTIAIREVGKTSTDQISFPCYRWLDEGEDDGKTHRILRNMKTPQLPPPRGNPMPHESEGAWKLKVKTSDLEGADTHAQVYLTVHGTKDYSHPIPLGNGSPTQDFFNQGKETTFDIELDEIGQMRKIRLEHDNRNPNPSLHIDWVHLLHVASGYECLFPFDCWLSEDHKDGQVFRERAVEIPGCMPSPVRHYVVLVQTGRAKDSGAHGGLCTVNLIGSQGETGQQLLMHPLSNVNDCMCDGITDVYMMEAVSVGEINRMRLGFEGRGRAKQWFVESVKVMESLVSQAEFVFKANTWLDDGEKSAITLSLFDKAVASSLPAGIDYTALGHHFPQSKGLWDLWVWTGRQDGASTSEPVNLWLYGTTGHSKPTHINEREALNSGSVLHTKINSSNLGEIFKIRLAFAERSANSSWYLERLKLKDADSKQEFNFEYNNWIQCADDNADGTIELAAIRPDITPLPEIKYTINVRTGDLPCAETSAEVTLMLIGQWGDSGQRSLVKPNFNREPFHRGQVDEFDFKLLDLGSISKILIGHSEQGRGVGWYCQQVAITSVSVDGEKIETIFDCNRWLDTGVDDRKTLREFSALGSIGPKDVRPGAESRGPWTCLVEMASEDQLDTSLTPRYSTNEVSLVVYGTNGAKGPVELGEGGTAKFALGTTEKFKSLQFGDIGDLIKIRVSTGLEEEDKTMWTINKVSLEDENTRECFHFLFDNDVGKIGGDVRNERPVLRPGTAIPALIKYKLSVETEDTPGAGTSAKGYATLYGSKGDSGRRILRTTKGIVHFQQGQVQTFEVEAVDLGDLEKLVLMKGPGDPWLLNQVTVKAGIFGPVENVFIWSNWIGDKEKRNDEVEVTLPMISSKPSTVAISADQVPDFPLTRGVWNIETLTGERGSTDKVDDVIVVFSGSKGESSPVPLKSARENPFQSGMTDTFEAHLAADVGELIKIRLGFEDNSFHKSWNLKKIKFEDKETQDTFWFSFNEAVQVDDVSDGWTEFPIVWPGIFILPVVEYNITVETGDVDGASTQAQILIQIDGQMGSTGYRTLKDTRFDKPKFQQGQTDTFVIKAVSLLSIYSLTVGHIDQNAGAGWYLSKVKVRPSNEEEDYVFNCNRWLDAGKDDGEIMRTLFVNDDDTATAGGTADEVMTARTQEEPVTEPEPEDGVSYEVTTVTGSGVGHGTKAPAIIVLYGEHGRTGPLIIGGGEDGFKEGETQHFKVHSDVEIGNLFKMRVGFYGEGKEQDWYSDLYQCPSWCPDMVKIQDKKTGKEFVFEMRQWVRMEEDHDHWKEVPVKKENLSQMLVVRDYFVDIHTGSKFGSGTDANVYLEIHGKNGDTGWRHMHGSRTNANKFETAAHDLFRLEAVDLGRLTKVIVKHDGYGPGSGWYLDHILVKESEDASDGYLFECDKWLDEGEDDQTLERELPLTRIISVTGDEKPKKPEEPKDGDWRIFTTTNSEPGSGTDANVTLTVIGNKGDSGPLPLASKGDNCFGDGQKDQFDIWLEPGDIGEIKKIRLEQDNSGSRSSWRVDNLVMENLFTGDKLTFEVARWLSADHKNGDTVYEGPAVYQDRPTLEVFKYVVKTVTEEKPESGTDANVYINIVGNNGDCGKRWLRHDLDNRQKFDIGVTNLFLVEAVDLGDLEKVIIGHDQSGQGSAWKLQCVMIRRSMADNQTIVFPWGKSIPEEGGKDQEVTILASSEPVNEIELEEKRDSVHPLPTNEGEDEVPKEDLFLNLPQSDRTEANNTYRTDEGIQEDYGIDNTYRSDDTALPPNSIAENGTETNNEQTGRMYTASDSTAVPGANDTHTYRDSDLNNTADEAPTERESDVNDDKINMNLESENGKGETDTERGDEGIKNLVDNPPMESSSGEVAANNVDDQKASPNNDEEKVEASQDNEDVKNTDRTEELLEKDHAEETKEGDNIDDKPSTKNEDANDTDRTGNLPEEDKSERNDVDEPKTNPETEESKAAANVDQSQNDNENSQRDAGNTTERVDDNQPSGNNANDPV